MMLKSNFWFDMNIGISNNRCKCFHSKMVQADPLAVHRLWWLAKWAQVPTLKKTKPVTFQGKIWAPLLSHIPVIFLLKNFVYTPSGLAYTWSCWLRSMFSLGSGKVSSCWWIAAEIAGTKCTGFRSKSSHKTSANWNNSNVKNGFLRGSE